MDREIVIRLDINVDSMVELREKVHQSLRELIENDSLDYRVGCFDCELGIVETYHGDGSVASRKHCTNCKS